MIARVVVALLALAVATARAADAADQAAFTAAAHRLSSGDPAGADRKSVV